MPRLSMRSPVGMLAITEQDGRIAALAWSRRRRNDDTPLLRRARAELEQYFEGKRTAFDLPLAPEGTPFMRHVWAIMRNIKYGTTLSYGELAVLAESHPRVVGQACAKNPIPIIIPCHRVLAANEALGGYSGGHGRETKAALLRLEGVLL